MNFQGYSHNFYLAAKLLATTSDSTSAFSLSIALSDIAQIENFQVYFI